jgi:hypothetical protein
MYYVAYGYWEEHRDWDHWLEETFLEESGWSYCEESKKAVQGKNQCQGYEIKGCLARNFCHVKHELVKQIQKAGRDFNVNSNFAKSRRGAMKDLAGIKRRKKGDCYFKSSKTSQAKTAAQHMVTIIPSRHLTLIYFTTVKQSTATTFCFLYYYINFRINKTRRYLKETSLCPSMRARIETRATNHNGTTSHRHYKTWGQMMTSPYQ